MSIYVETIDRILADQVTPALIEASERGEQRQDHRDGSDEQVPQRQPLPADRDRNRFEHLDQVGLRRHHRNLHSPSRPGQCGYLHAGPRGCAAGRAAAPAS